MDGWMPKLVFMASEF